MWVLYTYLGVPVSFWLWFLGYSQYRITRYGKHDADMLIFGVAMHQDDNSGLAVAMTLMWPLVFAISIIYSTSIGVFNCLCYPIKLIGTKLRQKDLAKVEHRKWLEKPVEEILSDR